jgi:hypothetical protein
MLCDTTVDLHGKWRVAGVGANEFARPACPGDQMGSLHKIGRGPSDPTIRTHDVAKSEVCVTGEGCEKVRRMRAVRPDTQFCPGGEGRSIRRRLTARWLGRRRGCGQW